MSDFGSRMKEYEFLETNRKLIPLLPVYIRLDGRCFSNFTKSMDKPYDHRMISAMIETTKYLVQETSACIGYTQSDEISLVLYSDSFDSQIFFDGNLFKITSILAGITSSVFYYYYMEFFKEKLLVNKLPVFDCRVMNLPTKTETANMILWRELDATRNAINSAASTIASREELFNKTSNERQEILFQKGINFNEYPVSFKRGTFIQKKSIQKEIEDEIWNRIPEHKRPDTRIVERKTVDILQLPPFSKIENREDVIFNNAQPQLKI